MGARILRQPEPASAPPCARSCDRGDRKRSARVPSRCRSRRRRPLFRPRKLLPRDGVQVEQPVARARRRERGLVAARTRRALRRRPHRPAGRSPGRATRAACAGGTPIASTVASSTPAASPRHPACAAADHRARLVGEQHRHAIGDLRPRTRVPVLRVRAASASAGGVAAPDRRRACRAPASARRARPEAARAASALGLRVFRSPKRARGDERTHARPAPASQA